MSKKFFGKCPNQSCTDCRMCYNYYECKERLARRRRQRAQANAAHAVKNTHCIRAPYQMNINIPFLSKITLKGVAIVLSIVLFLTTMGPVLVDWFTEIAVNLEYDWGIRTTQVVTPDVTELGVESDELVVTSNANESLTEETTTYPDAAPDEVYTATHEGARPYLVYFLTPEEKLMIAKVVYREARGECYEGKVAVAAVVINRYMSGEFGNSIYKVVTTKNQFADISRTTQAHLDSVPDCMKAVSDACHGWDPTREWFEDGALYFYNPNGDLSDEARAAREGVEQYAIGNHNFHIELNET